MIVSKGVTNRMPMFAGSTAALIGAGIGAAGSIGGAAIQAGAAGAARDAQTQALEQQRIQQQQALQFLQQQREDLQPFRQAALDATQELQGLADPNSSLAQAQRSRGTEAVQRQLAAQGLLRSTAQGDQLSNLEVGLEQNRAQILQALAGSGAGQAFANVGAQQAALAGQFGQGEIAQGNVIAQGLLNQGRIGAGLTGQLTNVGSNLLDQANAERIRKENLALQQSQVAQANSMLQGLLGGGAQQPASSSVIRRRQPLGFGVADSFSNSLDDPRFKFLFGS